MFAELRWLRSFIAIAREQHFSRAARKLNLAQPALTAHIQQLEEALGARLLDRSNRMQGLTPAGRALLPEAEAIISRADSLRSVTSAAMRGDRGSLRAGIIPPAAIPALADAFAQFARESPDVEVQLRQENQQPLIDALSAGDLDLVIGRAAGLAQISSRRLLIEEQGIVLRKSDPLAGSGVIRLRELAGRNLLLLRHNSHFGSNLLELAARHRVELKRSHVADDFPSLHWMVCAGMGIAPCSLLLRESLPPALVACRVRPAPPRLEIHALWLGKTPQPIVARWLQIATHGASRSGMTGKFPLCS